MLRQGAAVLESSDVVAFVAATDLSRARVFYEQTLGLPVTGQNDFAVFSRYPGMDQDENGVWTTQGGEKVAWFADPDGNTLSLTQFR
jgi:predicted enzyme related to lactoylglutathione lyase